MNNLPPTLDECRALLIRDGFTEFRGVGNVNLLGVRTVPGTLDAFDDWICVWADRADGGVDFGAYKATLDPGKPSIEHPTRKDGTAVMAAGIETKGAFKIGAHHPGTPGAYPCLVPAVPIPVVRFLGADDYAAGRGTPSTSTTTEIHHASSFHESTVVGPWTVGCAVTALASSLETILGFCRRQPARYGSTWTWRISLRSR